MGEDGFSEKIDLPGQSDIFEALLKEDSCAEDTRSESGSKESTVIKKQISFFTEDEVREKKYTGKIEAPIYRPRGQQPHIMLLCDTIKAKQLIREIDEALVSDAEKDFLRAAAWRHAVFHYERIADYYAHSSAQMKRLMEKSALVIVDFDRAIEGGFVNVCEEIRAQYFQEYGNVGDADRGDS